MADHTLQDLVAALDRAKVDVGAPLEVARSALRLERVREAAPALLAALERTWEVIDAAGLSALMRGVELGPTVWFVKASDARDQALVAMAAAAGEERLRGDFPTVAARSVESLQRELLAVARGGKFAEAWAKANGVQGSDGVNLRAEMGKLERVRELRAEIAAINPDAAMYYGWVRGDDRDPTRERNDACSAETYRLFGPKENP